MLSGSTRRVLLLAPGTLSAGKPAIPAIGPGPEAGDPGSDADNADPGMAGEPDMAGSDGGFYRAAPKTRQKNPPSDPAGAPETAARGGNGGNGGFCGEGTPAGKSDEAQYEHQERAALTEGGM